MEALRPWIAPLVEAALSVCVGRPQPAGLTRTPLKLSDDGSNIRVLVSDRRIVQVAEWSSAQRPIQGILSDSTTTVLGIFSAQSTDLYKKNARKDLNKGTKGALVGINRFEIVISYVKPSSPEISLYILDFQVEGCEGSGVFGNPAAVAKDPGIRDMAKDCLRLYNRQRNGASSLNNGSNKLDADAGSDSDTDMSLQSQDVSSPPSQSSNDQSVSQAQFVSQIPYDRVIENPRAPTRGENKRVPSKTTVGRLVAMISSKRAMDPPTGPQLSPDSRPKESTGSKQNHHTPRSARMGSEIDRIGSQPQMAPAERESVDREKSDVNGNAGNKAVVQSEHSTRSSSAAHDPQETCRTPQKNKATDGDQLSRTSQQGTPSDTVEQPRSGNNTNQETLHEPARPSHSRSNSGISRQTSKDKDTHLALKASDITERIDPWKNMKRIRRRDVVIPKDQEELIGNENSWIPPETGRRMPQGYVPINLLQEWNEIHNGNPIPEQEVQSPTPSPAEDNVERVQSSREPTPLDPDWGETPPPSSLSDLVPPDTSPLHSPRQRRLPSRKSYSPIPSSANLPVDPEPLPTKEHENEALQHPPDQSTNPHVRPGSDLATPAEDEDDDSEMEMAPPKGLGNSAQDESVVDEEITSSGPQLPISNKTSFTQVERSPYIQPSKANVGVNSRPGENAAPQKISSDPLIPATYERVRSDIHPDSSTHATGNIPQNTTMVSTQDFNPVDCGTLDYDETLVDRQLVSGLDEYTQNSYTDGYLDQSIAVHPPGTAISSDKPSSSLLPEPQMSSPSPVNTRKRQRDESSPEVRKPSKQPRLQQLQKEQSVQEPQKPLLKPEKLSKARRSNTITRRRSYFGEIAPSSPAEEVYQQFKGQYPDYTGSFDQFRQACSRLQLLRGRNLMKISIFRDDFVAEYPNYVLQHQNTRGASYEEYFQQTITKPRRRRRALQAKKIELVLAPQIHSREASSSTQPPPEQGASITHVPRQADIISKDGNSPAPSSPIPSQNEPKGKLDADAMDVDEDEDVSLRDELEACETLSVELGDPDSSFPPSGAQKRASIIDKEDINMDHEDAPESEYEVAESVTSSHHVSPAPDDADQGPDDDNNAIPESPCSKYSIRSSSPREAPPIQEPTTDELGLRRAGYSLLRSQNRSISPPCLVPKDPSRFYHQPNTPKPPLSIGGSRTQVRETNKPDQASSRDKAPQKLPRLSQAFVRLDGTADPIPIDDEAIIRPPPLRTPLSMQGMGWYWPRKK
ncbi:hypothetical protein FQN50_002709 [Emmonsiellopsis sp. PD_5]|nr:hypothetical protein FQN50_002709 [Emmonsiellopsis sp. PD_5]